MAENSGKEGGDAGASDGGGISSEIESLRKQLADAKRMLNAAKEAGSGKGGGALEPRPAGAKKGAGGGKAKAAGGKAKAAASPSGAQAGGQRAGHAKRAGEGKKAGESKGPAAGTGKAKVGTGAGGGKKPGAGKAVGTAGAGKAGAKKPGGVPQAKGDEGAGAAAAAAGKRPGAKKPGGAPQAKGDEGAGAGAAAAAGAAAGKRPGAKKQGAGKKAGAARPRRGSKKQEAGGGKAEEGGEDGGKAKGKGRGKAKAKDEKPKDRTLEEELEAQLTDAEIRNFMLEKHDMSRLTNRVCEILYENEGAGVVQNVLWKKLKLSGSDGARLALKLERRGIIDREKVVEKGRWTYRLILRKSPVSTESIENSPCLTCPVEARCAVDAEVSPLTCTLIESWVMAPAARGRSGRR